MKMKKQKQTGMINERMHFAVVLGLLLSAALNLSGEELAGDSPLFSTAVENAVRDLDKVGKKQAEEHEQKPPAQGGDAAIVEYIRGKLNEKSDAAGRPRVYVYWSRSRGGLTRFEDKNSSGRGMAAPQAASNELVCVYWCSKCSKFHQSRKLDKDDKGVVLSIRDDNIYVYWCGKCDKCHQTALKLGESEAVGGTEEDPACRHDVLSAGKAVDSAQTNNSAVEKFQEEK